MLTTLRRFPLYNLFVHALLSHSFSSQLTTTTTTNNYSYVPIEGPTRAVNKRRRNPPRHTLPEHDLRALRLRDAQRKRTRRQNMNEEERARERERDKARKAEKRRMLKEQPVQLPPVSTILENVPTTSNVHSPPFIFR